MAGKKKPTIDFTGPEIGIFYKELDRCLADAHNDDIYDAHTFDVLITGEYFKYLNYSEVSRRTGIPRNSISKYVRRTINKFGI